MPRSLAAWIESAEPAHGLTSAFGWNAWPVVDHGDHRFGIHELRIDADYSPLRRVMDGIPNEIEQYLRQYPMIAQNEGCCEFTFHEGLPILFGDGLHGFDDLGRHFRHVDRGKCRALVSAFNLGDMQYRTEQTQ